MPKNDNAVSIRLAASVEKHAGKSAADSYSETLYLSKSADFKRKAKWANDVCERLERDFDAETVKSIRADCSCDPPPRYMDEVKRLYESSSDPDDFCERYNEKYSGKHSVKRDGDSILFSYPECYCSCVKRAGAPVSRTWCLCTLGYAKKLFAHVLGRGVSAELIESVMTGGERCVMRITVE